MLNISSREKGIDLTRSYDKSPYIHRIILKQRDKISLNLSMMSNRLISEGLT